MPSKTTPRNTPLVLIIRDGWGLNPNPQHAPFDAVRQARTPVADSLMARYPWTLIKTSGEDVGLPEGTMGNSEVGHQNIGAGRVVPQESLVMTRACREGLHTNAAIKKAVETAKASNRPLHLLGINSDAGVHGLLEHLYAILAAAKRLGMPPDRVFIHLFTDGRDTGPFTGLEYARRVEAKCAELGIGRVASVMGRYYAMDRDHRWDRVKRAYDCLTGRCDSAPAFASASEAIKHYYDHPSGPTLKGDEFVTPAAIGTRAQIEASRIADYDSVIFYNYRGDRPRELCAAFVFPNHEWGGDRPTPDTGAPYFGRGDELRLHFVTMTDYWSKLKPHVSGVAFPKPPPMKNTAGEWLATQGLTQFRCAETEKYPHVTFFYNDYREKPYPGEHRENPPSPKVSTYDLQPEMSAEAVCAAVVQRLAATDCEDFLVVNFANPDMVGHTGSLPAAVKACETVDALVGRVVAATQARGGSLIIAADHGNAEQMWDPQTNAPHTAHTTYDVPLFIVGTPFEGRSLRGDRDPAGWYDPDRRRLRGRLCDIVPTALEMMGVPQPPEMTGRSLLA